MSLYPVVDHELLSRKARQYSTRQLELTTLGAETVLGLLGTTYSGDRAERAKVAVVRQVNLIAAMPENPFLESEGRGSKSKTFAVLRDLGGGISIDPIAQQIVQALATESLVSTPAGQEKARYGVLRSWRHG